MLLICERHPNSFSLHFFKFLFVRFDLRIQLSCYNSHQCFKLIFESTAGIDCPNSYKWSNNLNFSSKSEWNKKGVVLKEFLMQEWLNKVWRGRNNIGDTSDDSPFEWRKYHTSASEKSHANMHANSKIVIPMTDNYDWGIVGKEYRTVYKALAYDQNRRNASVRFASSQNWYQQFCFHHSLAARVFHRFKWLFFIDYIFHEGFL